MNIRFNEDALDKADRKPIWNEETLALAAKLWAEGFSSGHIGKLVGSTSSAVRGMMAKKRETFPARPKQEASRAPRARRGKWTKDKIETCSRLWASGMTQSAIGKQIRMTKFEVDALMRKRRDIFPMGVDRHKPAAGVVAIAAPVDRSWIGDRWVDWVSYTTISGAVVTLPRVSILNRKEA